MTDMEKLETRQSCLSSLWKSVGNLFRPVQKHYAEVNFMNTQTQKQNLKKRLVIQTMINLLVEYDVLSWTDIEQREERKREKLKVWSDLI